MVDDEELSYESINKLKKLLLDRHNLTLVVMIALVIMAFFVGTQMGYRQGYTYVDNWHKNYLDRHCICSETPRPTTYSPNDMRILQASGLDS